MQRGRTTDTPAGSQSQRDCVCQPRVARNELPWVAADSDSNPNGVASRFQGLATTPLGLFGLAAMSQGSSFLATLGFRPESLWDSVLELRKGIERLPGSGVCPLPGSFSSRRRARERNAILQSRRYHECAAAISDYHH